MQVHAKIQKWGNSLGLRLSGSLRDIPQFTEGTTVTIEITEEGLTVKKIKLARGLMKLPYSEKELVVDMLSHDHYSDLLLSPLKNESAD